MAETEAKVGVMKVDEWKDPTSTLRHKHHLLRHLIKKNFFIIIAVDLDLKISIEVMIETQVAKDNEDRDKDLFLQMRLMPLRWSNEYVNHCNKY